MNENYGIYIVRGCIDGKNEVIHCAGTREDAFLAAKQLVPGIKIYSITRDVEWKDDQVVMTKGMDYKQWADRFASITEEFIWIHSGSNNGNDLNLVFREALNAMTEYSKEKGQPQKVPLKRSIEDAYKLAIANDLDPWSVVLRTIAERAEDWENYASDDETVPNDIRKWLKAEASSGIKE